MRWKIYYSDTTYNGAIENCPTRDVQIILQKDSRVGWAMLHQKDYYVWKDARWFGVDEFGLWDYLASDGWKKVLFGRTLTNAEFKDVYCRAKDDRDFGRKEGYLKSERRCREDD